MPTKPKPALKAWSFSRYRLDQTCGFKLELTAIRGLKEPGNKYMERGNEIHGSADFYVRGLIAEAELPTALENFTEEFKRLRKGFAKKKVHCELEYNYYRDWTPATDKFDRSIWYRGRADARELLPKRVRIIDYKTGKPGDLDQDQLELYVVSEYVANPKADFIGAELWYLDLGEIVTIKAGAIDGWVSRAEAEKLKQKWTAVGEAMTKPDRQFLPRPNEGCRWCHFRKDNNGPCKY